MRCGRWSEGRKILRSALRRSDLEAIAREQFGGNRSRGVDDSRLRATIRWWSP